MRLRRRGLQQRGRDLPHGLRPRGGPVHRRGAPDPLRHDLERHAPTGVEHRGRGRACRELLVGLRSVHEPLLGVAVQLERRDHDRRGRPSPPPPAALDRHLRGAGTTGRDGVGGRGGDLDRYGHGRLVRPRPHRRVAVRLLLPDREFDRGPVRPREQRGALRRGPQLHRRPGVLSAFLPHVPGRQPPERRVLGRHVHERDHRKLDRSRECARVPSAGSRARGLQFHSDPAGRLLGLPGGGLGRHGPESDDPHPNVPAGRPGPVDRIGEPEPRRGPLG